MNKIYQKSFASEKNAGFTLIELLVVVLVVGILSAVALPQYQLAVDKSRFLQSMVYCDHIARAQEEYKMANGRYTGDITLLTDPLPSKFQLSVDHSLDRSGAVSGGTFVFMNPGVCYAELWGVQTGRFQRHFNTGKRYCAAWPPSARYTRLCASLGKKTGESFGGYDLYEMR